MSVPQLCVITTTTIITILVVVMVIIIITITILIAIIITKRFPAHNDLMCIVASKLLEVIAGKLMFPWCIL